MQTANTAPTAEQLDFSVEAMELAVREQPAPRRTCSTPAGDVFTVGALAELSALRSAAFAVDQYVGVEVVRLCRQPAGDAGIVQACGEVVRFLFQLPEGPWWIDEDTIGRVMELANNLADRLVGVGRN